MQGGFGGPTTKEKNCCDFMVGKIVVFSRFVAIFGKKNGSFSPKMVCENPFPAIL